MRGVRQPARSYMIVSRTLKNDSMAAEKQHYVPQFILRQFLANERDERVTVYDKHDDKTFVTSIKNIMAERRFNEFYFEELLHCIIRAGRRPR
jgi:hypothetical protein